MVGTFENSFAEFVLIDLVFCDIFAEGAIFDIE